MEILLISLEERLDRRQRAEAALSILELPIVWIPGVVCDENSNPSNFVTNEVAGCWLAHVKAFEYAAISSRSVLIVEDDLILRGAPQKLLEIIKKFEESNLDLLQIGYIESGYLEIILRKIHSVINYMESVFVSICLRCPPRFTLKVSKRVRFQEAHSRLIVARKLGVFQVVNDDFLAGTHAYLVNANFASILKEMNDPIVFSADQFLMSLSAMRTFRIYRLGKSIVTQNLKLKSDIAKNRFLGRADHGH